MNSRFMKSCGAARYASTLPCCRSASARRDHQGDPAVRLGGGDLLGQRSAGLAEHALDPDPLIDDGRVLGGQARHAAVELVDRLEEFADPVGSPIQ